MGGRRRSGRGRTTDCFLLLLVVVGAMTLMRVFIYSNRKEKEHKTMQTILTLTLSSVSLDLAFAFSRLFLTAMLFLSLRRLYSSLDLSTFFLHPGIILPLVGDLRGDLHRESAPGTVVGVMLYGGTADGYPPPAVAP